MAILFYSAKGIYGGFSNFSPHGFELGHHFWRTSEHYFQAQKFAGTEHERLVREAHTPKRAAEMGRERSRPLRVDWEEVKDEIMFKAVLRKFSSHPDLREVLLGTGEEMLVENAPHDYYWGCGRDGSGRNQLGLTLMKIRDILREESA